MYCLFVVVLKATGDSDFRGYFIQARTATNTTGLGTFSVESTEAKTMDCPGGTAVCVTILYFSIEVYRDN